MIGARGLSVIAVAVMASLGAPALAQPGMTPPQAGDPEQPAALGAPSTAPPAPAPAPPPPTYTAPAYAPRYAYPPMYTPGVPLPAPVVDLPDRGEDRRGVLLGGGFGLGRLVQAELRLGVMVTPHFALFGAVTKAGDPWPDGGQPVKIWSAGARLWIDRLYLEARIGKIDQHEYCDRDDFGDAVYCGRFSNYDALAQVGFGIELVHRNHVGFEVHLDNTIIHGHSTVTGGLGLNFYLF